MSVSQMAAFKEAAQRLKNASPAQFSDFLQEFNAYVHEVTVAVTDAPSDQVLLMQGRAQQARALLRCLVELK